MNEYPGILWPGPIYTPGYSMACGGMNWPRPKYTPGYKLAWAMIYPGILRPGVYSGLLHLCLFQRHSGHSGPIDCEVRCPRSPSEITEQGWLKTRQESVLSRSWTTSAGSMEESGQR